MTNDKHDEEQEFRERSVELVVESGTLELRPGRGVSALQLRRGR